MTNPHQKIVKIIMESNEFTQEALAEKTGIDQPTISRILTGKRRLTIQTLVRLIPLMGDDELQNFFREVQNEFSTAPA